MHGAPSDHRDSTWERDDARYRVWIFAGPDNAVTTFDLTDATVEDALEAAHAMSRGDELLWSLALVELDERGLPGLLWLSGMDYNDAPGSAREWRRRRQMQDRYLRSRSTRGVPLVLPNGLRVIRVFPEWIDGEPLWESFSDDYHQSGAALGLSPELSADLRDWNARWSMRTEDAVDDGWEDEGLALVARLRIELDGVAEVRPEFLTDSAGS